MQAEINRDRLNRLRGYSSIFSSTYFAKLLKLKDYSFIDDKIIKFDQDLIGSSIFTYNDYIKYIYKELRKEYRNEYIYKNTFIKKFVIGNYALSETNVINEFKVGNSVADMVLFNGTSKAFEIKTELDSNKRLQNQLIDYKKIFNKSYIITHERLANKYLLADNKAGLIILKENSRSLQMEEIREAVVNDQICYKTLMRSVRTSEYKNIIKQYYGSLPIMNSFTMFNDCEILMGSIPSNILSELFNNELKKRKNNTVNLRKYQAELKQLSLSMNLNRNSYDQLIVALNQPINF